MTMIAMPHQASDWFSRLVRHAGGRTHLVRAGVISIVLGVLAGVTCGLFAPGSHEVVTSFGDLPAWPQDEVRVAAEVWFTIVLSAVAIVSTIVWWGPFRGRAHPAEPQTPGQEAPAADPTGDPVEAARGPIGLAIATAAAMIQTGIAMLVWHPTVALRDFAEPGEVGTDRIAAPVLSGATSLWVGAVCAVLTYLVLVILAPTSALTSRPKKSPAQS